MKLWLARIGVWIERQLGRGRAVRQAGAIVPYIGYATPEHLVVRGRVLAKLRDKPAYGGRNRWCNVRQTLRLFLTAEVGDVTVSAGDVTAQTDEEGYFTLLLPRDDQEGWREITVHVGEISVACPVMVARTDAHFAVVSDIDDTMMHTGAYALTRNLWNSLTGNAATRVVFPDAVALMAKLSEDGRNPVHYVSSSPWNFHGMLTDVFDRNALPRGPMFLRDYGISETQFITGTHGDHKGASIDVLMSALPELPFVLIGDTGQHDAGIYLSAAHRHPGRVQQVILRATADGVDAADQADIDAIRALGIPVDVGPDYSAALSRDAARRSE
ncbi:phosphatase domain-containing protein [Loktanella agnita]|uniref:phosphatase domain-containing protein n=1 Tax=Loktanella agnita TaxID=287097 RepID=UPI003985BB47